MRLFNKENKNKETHRLPMGQKSKRALRSTRPWCSCCAAAPPQLLPPAIR